MRLLGLTGPAGVGKDTVAVMLSGYGYTAFSFAEPMKKALAVLGLPEPGTRAEKEALVPGYDFTWRAAAQRLGTEWAHPLDRNFWVKNLEQRMANAPGASRFMAVVTDVRFTHEVDWLRAKGGTLIHIRGRDTTVHGAMATHSSEAGVPFGPGDKVLENTGTLHELHEKVFNLLRGL